MMLIVATVATPFNRFQLREFLFPVTQNVRFDTTQLADFTDREVAFCWNGRQCDQFGFVEPFVHLSAGFGKRFLAGSVDHAFELLARMESNYAACGDRNFFTCFWITARTLRFVAQLKVTETG